MGQVGPSYVGLLFDWYIEPTLDQNYVKMSRLDPIFRLLGQSNIKFNLIEVVDSIEIWSYLNWIEKNPNKVDLVKKDLNYRLNLFIGFEIDLD